MNIAINLTVRYLNDFFLQTLETDGMIKVFRILS